MVGSVSNVSMAKQMNVISCGLVHVYWGEKGRSGVGHLDIQGVHVKGRGRVQGRDMGYTASHNR